MEVFVESQSETFAACNKRVEIATAPFLYASSTRVGCECIVDGVGAFDLISRRDALLEIDGGDQIMP